MNTAPLADERGVVGVSLIRWTIVLVILGLVVIEGGSIIFTSIGLQNTADAAAIEAAEIWEKTGNVESAREAAIGVFLNQNQEDARIPPAQFEADGSPTFEVRFVAVKQASTLFVHRIGFLEDLAEVRVEAKARPAEPGV